MIYLAVKVLHIVAVVAWMAGLFYLPRLFVYHADTEVGSGTDLLFRTMERRLLQAIMRPAALVAIASGGVLAVLGLHYGEIWFWAKMAGVVGMVIFHGVLENHWRMFAGGLRVRSARFFRIINEVPTVLLIWIVFCVVFQGAVF